jgi:hypothetical protein
MVSQKKTIVVVLVIASMMMIAGVLALIQSTKTIHSSGIVAGVNLGVFLDVNCINPVNSINWTDATPLNPGGSVTQQVYVENSGTTDMTLGLSSSNWLPSGVNANLTLTWDKEGATVHTGVANATLATLTLTAISGFTTGTSFSFDVTITGSHT